MAKMYLCRKNSDKMIQRIQTIFLLLASIAAVLAFFFPIAWFYGDQHILELFAYKVVDHVKENSPILSDGAFIPASIVGLVLVALPLLIIFQYKRLNFQLRLTGVAILIAVIQIGLQLLFYVSKLTRLTGAEADYSFGVFIPLIVVVFLILAQRGIRNDIRLLRSVDRLR